MNISAEIVQPFALFALLLIAKATIIGLSRFFFAGTGKIPYGQLTPGIPQGPRWYASLNRAYINGIEAFALLAPAVLLHLTYKTPPSPSVASLLWVFLMARMLYTLVYLSMGYKVWCSIIWLVGFGATLVTWMMILT